MVDRRAGEVLAPYLPRVAIEWGGLAPGAQWLVLEGSLVFVDVSGFTALSERLGRKGRVGAEELTGVISGCFAELLAVAYGYQGSLLKFGGDALLLLFDGDDHEARACAGAMGMRARLRTAGRIATSVGPVRLRMSVGVHSGELHFFRVGESHKELMLAGPAATTTVEMEAAAESGEIVVSPVTATRVDQRLLGDAKGPGLLLRNRRVDDGPAPFPVPPEVTTDLRDAVPVALRPHLLSGKVESEHRSASVAFVHFDGIDRLILDEGPIAAARALDELVRDTQAAADDAEVTFLATDVDRDGGKIILVAGAPTALEDDEGRMLRTVRRIVDGSRRLPVRVGVNRGQVFVGEVGPPYRRTYTVMGDAVNLAARLMAKAEPGQTVVTAGVLERSRTAFETTALPPFMVKGKSQPVEAWSLGAATGVQQERSVHELPFTGRARELKTLLAVVEEARRGRGGFVELLGDGGIGKSRLIAELTSRATDLPAFVAACEPYESRTPYYAVGQLVRGVLGIEAGRDAGEQLERRVADAAPHLLPWLPLLGDVIGATVAPTADTMTLEPRFRRDRTNWAVLQVLRAVLTTPSLLVVEDTHWMDDASEETLAVIEATVTELPWLVCVARRGEPASVAAERGARRRVLLTPLGTDDATNLVAEATRDTPLRPHLRDALVRQAGGNPLFLGELLAHAEDGHGGGDAVPESLEALVVTQIDRLSPGGRRLLRHAAVLGVAFETRLLQDVVDADLRSAAAGATQHLRGFVEPAGRGALRFRNQSFRDVAYHTLPFRRRREIHARAGQAIESMAVAADLPERAEVLSLHFMQAGDHARCWHYATLAAERAEAKFANVEAAELYDRAIAVSGHIEDLTVKELAGAWVALGNVCVLGGMYDRARPAFARARKLRSGDPIGVAHLCGVESRIAERQQHLATAVRWIRKGLRLLDTVDSPEALVERSWLRVLYAWNRQAAGHPREALRACQQAIAEAEASDNRSALAHAYMVMDWANLELGRPDLATNGYAALAIWEELHDLGEQAVLLNNLGAFAFYRGAWDEAVALYARGRDANTRIGNVVDAAFGTCNIAEILIDQGRLDEAETALHEVIELWRSVGYNTAVAFAVRHLGRVAIRRNEHETAIDLLADAKKTFAESGLATKELEVDAWLAESLLRRGQLDQALTLLDDALRREKASGGTGMLAMLHRLRGYAYIALDRRVDAWAEFDESLHIARARQAHWDVALTLEAMAVAGELGGIQADPEAVEERAALLEQLGVRAAPSPPLPDRGLPVVVAAG